MLRRQARLRRGYHYRKAMAEKQKAVQEKKDEIKNNIDSGTVICTSLRDGALNLLRDSRWEDKKLVTAIETESETCPSHEDDEYRFAGIDDPKVMITTARDPSPRLKIFAKEIRLIFPNAQKLNRGNYDTKQLIHACRANNVTDLIIIHEHKGIPDNLIICHLPYGPTAYFNVSDVTMRHDVPEIEAISEQIPHLIFHNFKTRLGLRVMSILKYLFPIPKEESERVITFANHDDYIAFRHHTYKRINGSSIDLNEVGPRFILKLYEIKLGTLDSIETAPSEWVLKPCMNASARRRFLSEEDGWNHDEVMEIL